MKCLFIYIYIFDGSYIHDSGYTIPEGWLVLMNPMAIHLNPLIFDDPLTFNPWRWQVSKK
jgi:cytochrome P450